MSYAHEPFEKRSDQMLHRMLIGLSTFFVATALVGIWNNYSPVPYWDMWGGNLGFFFKAQAGDWGSWWMQHNEHRIFWSRILFWLDLAYLGGSHVLLFVFNFILGGAVCATFWQIAKAQYPSPQKTTEQPTWPWVILALAFSWIQQDNFTCAFQSQFFLAQLVPLWAFHALHRSTLQPHRFFPFLTACALGAGAIGTMANGILALPVMVIMGIFLGLPKNRLSLLVGFSLLGFWLYFRDYVPPSEHVAFHNLIFQNPLTVIAFGLIYLGAPFYYMGQQTSLVLPLLGGVLWILLCLRAFLNAWQTRDADRALFSWRIGLIGFLLYIGMTALITASSRNDGGLTMAVTSRYMTPSLMSWIAIGLLHVQNPARHTGAAVLILALLVPAQLFAIHSRERSFFERQVAALALNLGVHDSQQIKVIEPSADEGLHLARLAIQQEVSIFNAPLMRDARLAWGEKDSTAVDNQPLCRGVVTQITAIEDDHRYSRIEGWLMEPQTNKAPQGISILNTDHVKVGYAMTGKRGFKGYILNDNRLHSGPLIFNGQEPACIFTLQEPLP